jgi:hypothetical protein
MGFSFPRSAASNGASLLGAARHSILFFAGPVLAAGFRARIFFDRISCVSRTPMSDEDRLSPHHVRSIYLILLDNFD